MKKILSSKFYSHSAQDVAVGLLGKLLVKDGQTFIITETEAYHGCDDKASHAYKGLTEHNFVMFGPPGYWYVYLVYGMYNMLNIVTGLINEPSAVLIRGIKKLNGPGKLTKFLKIDRSYNNQSADKKTGLYIQDSGIKIIKKNIKTGPRIGVAYAKEWADKPYRFWLEQ